MFLDADLLLLPPNRKPYQYPKLQRTGHKRRRRRLRVDEAATDGPALARAALTGASGSVGSGVGSSVGSGMGGGLSAEEEKEGEAEGVARDRRRGGDTQGLSGGAARRRALLSSVAGCALQNGCGPRGDGGGGK